MDLQDHAGFEFALGELVVEGDHGQLDEVGGSALQGRVDGGALGKAALVGIAALDVGDGADAAEERTHTAGFARGFESLFDKRFDARVALEVAVDVGLSFAHRNAELRSQAEGRNAVDNAEVDGLGAVAGLLVHSGGGHTEDFAGGEGVNVFVVLIGAHEERIAAEVGEQAQFDLGVVGGEQLRSWSGDEGGANLAAQFGADGNVLQVGIDGGEASGGHSRCVEGGVDARIDVGQQRQGVDVGRFQLR